MDEYKTLAQGVEVSGEFVDRKSRFIAQMRQCTTIEQADAFIDEVRARHRDARHNVPAWIMSDGSERTSDDGEPQHTAGMPTLEVLRHEGLADVCCVVTRYFGGTLLGPGGLVRAYTAATQQAVQSAIDEGAVVEMCLVTNVVACIPYSAYDQVRNLAERFGGKVRDSIFAQDVQLTVAFHAGEQDGFVDAVRELACGDELCLVHDPVFAEF